MKNVGPKKRTKYVKMANLSPNRIVGCGLRTTSKKLLPRLTDNLSFFIKESHDKYRIYMSNLQKVQMDEP